MNILDTSALIAVIDKEPDYLVYAATMANADTCVASSVTLQEASIVMLGRRGPAGVLDLRSLLAAVEATIVPFTVEDNNAATDAYVRFGKGRSTRANVNMCDCIAYALAQSRDAALLYKGADFGHTDIRSALAPD